MSRPKDALGRELRVGQDVVKASRYGSSVSLDKRTVARIEGITVWLDGPRARPVDPSNIAIVDLWGH